MAEDHDELGHLDDPPIVEVVCGVKFKPLQGLDPIVLGAYWQERAGEYPNREVHDALQDQDDVVTSPAQIVRFWIVSANGEFLLQLQHDRFFLNWRRVKDGRYPRFNDRDGQSGVLSRMLREFQTFSDFCERTVGARPVLVRSELSKIDHLIEGQHWRDLTDLAQMLPWLQTFAAFSITKSPTMVVQFAEPRKEGNLVVSLRTVVSASTQKTEVRNAILLETRVLHKVSAETNLSEVFTEANDEVNRVFGHMIPAHERRRFMRKEDAK